MQRGELGSGAGAVAGPGADPGRAAVRGGGRGADRLKEVGAVEGALLRHYGIDCVYLDEDGSFTTLAAPDRQTIPASRVDDAPFQATARRQGRSAHV